MAFFNYCPYNGLNYRHRSQGMAFLNYCPYNPLNYRHRSQGMAFLNYCPYNRPSTIDIGVREWPFSITVRIIPSTIEIRVREWPFCQLLSV